MKRTGKAWIFFVLELVFFIVIPLILIWVQYGTLAKKYKISVTAILLTILIFWVFKKVLLNTWLKTLDNRIVAIETNALSTTDEKAIISNKKAWRLYSLVQLIFSLIVPLLIMALSGLTIKVVEQGLIKLYGVLMFCFMSIFVGVLFRICEIYSMRLTHEK